MKREPIQTRIDDELGFAVQTIVAPISADDLVAAQTKLFVDMAYPPEGAVLWETTVEGSITPMRLDGIVDAVRKIRPVMQLQQGGRTALVAPNLVHFAMARMYTQIAGDVEREMQVFRNRASAIDWWNGDG